MNSSRKRLIAILSLSMAGALVGTGISPALNAIGEYFPNSDPIMIQMVVSLPSLLVLAVAAVFSQISRHISMRDICAISLILFTIGGVMGYFADSMAYLIFSRVLVGVGYGLMMPMSVGLLSYFYKKEEQQKLNGYIVIQSSVISIISMVLVGYLASISWRLCFLVYLFGIPCLWYNWKYIPNIILDSPKNRISWGLIKRIWPYAVGVFSIMVIYFSVLNNCSNIIISEGTVSAASVGAFMSIQTFSSLFTGIFMDQIKRLLGQNTKYAIWGLALVSMLCLSVPQNVGLLVLGLVFLGISLAMAVGLFNASACVVCLKEEALSATSVVSFTRCLGQFISPILISFVQGIVGISAVRFPYYFGIVLTVIMLIIFIPVQMIKDK